MRKGLKFTEDEKQKLNLSVAAIEEILRPCLFAAGVRKGSSFQRAAKAIGSTSDRHITMRNLHELNTHFNEYASMMVTPVSDMSLRDTVLLLTNDLSHITAKANDGYTKPFSFGRIITSVSDARFGSRTKLNHFKSGWRGEVSPFFTVNFSEFSQDDIWEFTPRERQLEISRNLKLKSSPKSHVSLDDMRDITEDDMPAVYLNSIYAHKDRTKTLSTDDIVAIRHHHKILAETIQRPTPF